jgi:2-hydroxychromene-2-carboxylate isomerase
LRTIVERAGLSWADARLALKDEAWRAVAERNREALLALGLWGVPSLQVQDVAVWGQDRLWAIEDKLRAGHPGHQEKTP